MPLGVKIFRSPDIWMDRNRVYKVIIDSKAVGELWPRENGFFDLPPGEHRVQVKIDFMRSQEIPSPWSRGKSSNLLVGLRILGSALSHTFPEALISRPPSNHPRGRDGVANSPFDGTSVYHGI